MNRRERPILFSAPMVRAILDGSKTQTRRVVKPQPPDAFPFAGFTVESSCDADVGSFTWRSDKTHMARIGHRLHCPHGRVGQRLWVRESYAPSYFGHQNHGYRADWTGRAKDVCPEPRWTPSIHMKRAHSRVTLEVTGVRVERLHDITEQDAVAEGVMEYGGPAFKYPSYVDYEDVGDNNCFDAARDSFASLWKSINGAESWVANPWVWVVEFREETT